MLNRSSLERLLNWRHFPWLIVALLLIPHLTRGRPYDVKLGAPLIFTGDEPHYLILVNSLIADGDLDLANNYEAVHTGNSWDAGVQWGENRSLDHHTLFRFEDRVENWRDHYSPISPNRQGWSTDPYGRYYREPLPGKVPVPPGVPEYSTHQPGQAYLLAPMVFPFRGTRWVEVVTVWISGLAVVGAFFFFRGILRALDAEEASVNLVSTAAFLGTTVWFYGRSFFPESFLLFFVCGAYAVSICGRHPVWAGVCIGWAIQLKAYYLLAGIPIGIDYLLRRKFRATGWYSVPILLSLGLFCWQNYLFFGHPLQKGQDFLLGNFEEGAVGQLISLKWGLIVFSPVVLLVIPCWGRFAIQHPRPACLLGVAFLANYALISWYQVWTAGHCCGPRYMTPYLPFLFAAIAIPATSPLRWGRIWWALFSVLFWLSIYANANAAIRHFRYWESSPLVEGWTYVSEKLR